jgi:thiol-disulfide isomerase/thioredoxin
MGRLPALACVLVAASCDAPSKPASGGRSEQVVASGTFAVSTSAVASSDHPPPATPRGALCTRSSETRAVPKSPAAFVDATGAVSDRAQAAWDGKRARWVSFFASWCGPCKEEIPRIRRFAQRLESDGIPVDVEYVSIDDDLRQLTAFLAQEPQDGIKSAFWLKDGPIRNAWLASLKLTSEPPLPEHGLFDGKGKLRCWVSGAIDERDYQELATALR